LEGRDANLEIIAALSQAAQTERDLKKLGQVLPVAERAIRAVTKWTGEMGESLTACIPSQHPRYPSPTRPLYQASHGRSHSHSHLFRVTELEMSEARAQRDNEHHAAPSFQVPSMPSADRVHPPVSHGSSAASDWDAWGFPPAGGGTNRGGGMMISSRDHQENGARQDPAHGEPMRQNLENRTGEGGGGGGRGRGNQPSSFGWGDTTTTTTTTTTANAATAATTATIRDVPRIEEDNWGSAWDAPPPKPPSRAGKPRAKDD